MIHHNLLFIYDDQNFLQAQSNYFTSTVSYLRISKSQKLSAN